MGDKLRDLNDMMKALAEAIARNEPTNEIFKGNPQLVEMDVDPEEAKIIHEVVDEINRAVQTYGPLQSYQEGRGILAEEVDELFDEIRAKPSVVDTAKIRKEAVQVAAVAVLIARGIK